MVNQLSEKGQRHYIEKVENQDSICFGENERFSVISLADGVSTCKRSREGAEIASRAITDLMLQKGSCFLGYNETLIASNVLTYILYRLHEQAKEDAAPVHEYSSTLASVLLDKVDRKILYFSVGDSLIVAAGNQTCRILALPSDSSRGCCVTTTRNAALGTMAQVEDALPYESVVIFSDGAWRHLFAKNRLKPEVIQWIADQDYEQLKEYLALQKCSDDYSFISMDLQAEKDRQK